MLRNSSIRASLCKVHSLWQCIQLLQTFSSLFQSLQASVRQKHDIHLLCHSCLVNLFLMLLYDVLVRWLRLQANIKNSMRAKSKIKWVIILCFHNPYSLFQNFLKLDSVNVPACHYSSSIPEPASLQIGNLCQTPGDCTVTR